MGVPISRKDRLYIETGPSSSLVSWIRNPSGRRPVWLSCVIATPGGVCLITSLASSRLQPPTRMISLYIYIYMYMYIYMFLGNWKGSWYVKKCTERVEIIAIPTHFWNIFQSIQVSQRGERYIYKRIIRCAPPSWNIFCFGYGNKLETFVLLI